MDLGIKNTKLSQWIEEIKNLCTPKDVYLCTGDDEEYKRIAETLVKSKVFTKLSDEKKSNSYLARTHASDVARIESRTFICTNEKKDVGPTNNWAKDSDMKRTLKRKFSKCMKGRTLYIIPFCMGPYNSSFSKLAVELTDSPYVVLNMKIMTRMGSKALKFLDNNAPFIPCLHSIGAPLNEGEEDSLWPCEKNIDEKYICHFPNDPSIWSYGSGYGGNALLGKKCLALRIGSSLGYKEGYLAEHMLLLSLTSPENKTYYIAAAFPSACGKTNLAMMMPTLLNWKVKCLGDDIAWIRPKSDGRLWAINPEFGLFGVAPGTSYQSNPNAMKALQKNTIFTNVALTQDGDVWWEGMPTPMVDASLTDWKGMPWTKESGLLASHANARFTTPLSQCPCLDPKWDSPEGVPLSAILFGGRRPSTIPLVAEAFSWEHGVFMGATMGSETTAANIGAENVLRRDPFAMLPFCGYNMAYYLKHWLSFKTKTDPHKLPKIFTVNWFRKNAKGNFIWPGYGDNARVLKWVVERIEGKAKIQNSPIGILPSSNALNLTDLNIPKEELDSLLSCDKEAFKKEAQSIETFFKSFGEEFPQELLDELDALKARLE